VVVGGDPASHASGRPHADGHRRGSAVRLPGADLRRGLEVERTSAPYAEESRVRVVQTPLQAPHCNAHAERVVRSIKEECVNRVIPIGERHFRRAMHKFVEHYHRRTPSSGTRQ
jgi:hypothetical protein